MTDEVVIRRVIPVPRETIFAAWLDPATLAKFMRPGHITRATADVDARVGGAFRIVMEHGRGDAEHWGEYLTIEPPSLLSFTWISANTDLEASVVTIELHEHGSDETELILTHRRLPAAKMESHRNGWTMIVEMLADVITPR
jgi:uncharacterized protein YndB with AHSA1/START domain